MSFLIAMFRRNAKAFVGERVLMHEVLFTLVIERVHLSCVAAVF
jgi:hypothetical protein